MADLDMNERDVLLVVDVQNDFCPGGRLAVPNGDDVVDVINQAIRRAEQAGALILASRDWHPRHHVSFESEGGPWPEHCVQDTEGAAFHADLRLPDDVIKVSKGVRLDKDQYSVFDETGLAEFLRKRGIERLWVAGLAQDVCVHATVMSAREEGFDVILIEDGTRPIDEADGRKAVDEMRDAGAEITEAAA